MFSCVMKHHLIQGRFYSFLKGIFPGVLQPVTDAHVSRTLHTHITLSLPLAANDFFCLDVCVGGLLWRW